MVSNKKGKDEETVAIIEYDYPEEIPEFFATGARFLVLGPYQVKMNLFVDEPIDDVAKEELREGKKGNRKVIVEKAYDGPRRVRRRFVASISLPMQTYRDLAKTTAEMIRDQEREE